MAAGEAGEGARAWLRAGAREGARAWLGAGAVVGERFREGTGRGLPASFRAPPRRASGNGFLEHAQDRVK